MRFPFGMLTRGIPVRLTNPHSLGGSSVKLDVERDWALCVAADSLINSTPVITCYHPFILIVSFRVLSSLIIKHENIIIIIIIITQ